MYLNSLELLQIRVDYDNLGMCMTALVMKVCRWVRQQYYAHALSTHPPARLYFHGERRLASFTCQVALNDDVTAGVSHADFGVIANGREVVTGPVIRCQGCISCGRKYREKPLR